MNQVQINVVEPHTTQTLFNRKMDLIVLVETTRQLRCDQYVFSWHVGHTYSFAYRSFILIIHRRVQKTVPRIQCRSNGFGTIKALDLVCTKSYSRKFQTIMSLPDWRFLNT